MGNERRVDPPENDTEERRGRGGYPVHDSLAGRKRLQDRIRPVCREDERRTCPLVREFRNKFVDDECLMAALMAALAEGDWDL